MATSVQTNHPTQTNSDATFRTWIQKIQAGLLACGLVQASDTGQIDSSTVTMPGTNNTSQGYEIWKFNDSLQATAPIYFKIEYGSATGSSTPSFWVTVGTGSDGAGTINGQAGTRVHVAVNAASATNFSSLFCHVSGSFAMVVHGAGTNSPSTGHVLTFIIDRVPDTSGSGAFTNDIFWITGALNSGSAWQYIPRSGTIATRCLGSGTWPGWPGPNDNTSPISDKGFAPMLPYYGYPRQPPLGLCVVQLNDFAVDDTPTLTRYGTTRTYRVASRHGTQLVLGGLSQRPAIIWE